MLVRAPRTLRGRVGMLRALHARAAYVPRESVRTAYSVREPADTGSNMQLDPRGVDYALFELPSEEYQTPDGEALRDDEHFAYVAAWQHAGDAAEPRLHKEPLEYENVKLATRSYK